MRVAINRNIIMAGKNDETQSLTVLTVAKIRASAGKPNYHGFAGWVP